MVGEVDGGEERVLKLTVVDRGREVEITLSGVISERSEMSVSKVPPDRRVIIDAGGVLNINSFGVRTWVNFVAGVVKQAPGVTVRRLPPVLVTQASMIANFLAGVRVESFFSPWCCIECDHEALQLHQVNDVLPDTVSCSECGGEMEFDGIRESYLAFRHG
jgi:hypothetical protein